MKKVLFLVFYVIFGTFLATLHIKGAVNPEINVQPAPASATQPAQAPHTPPKKGISSRMHMSQEGTYNFDELLETSPMKSQQTTPRKRAAVSPIKPSTPSKRPRTSPQESPGFSKIDITSFANSKSTFMRFMEFFINNICIFGDDSDEFVKTVKNAFSEEDFKKTSDKIRAIVSIDRGNMFLYKTATSKIECSEKSEIVNLTRFFYLLKIKELIGLKSKDIDEASEKSAASEATPMEVDFGAKHVDSDFRYEPDKYGQHFADQSESDTDQFETDESGTFEEFNFLFKGGQLQKLYSIIVESGHEHYLLETSLPFFQSDQLDDFSNHTSFIIRAIEQCNKAKFAFIFKIFDAIKKNISEENLYRIYRAAILLIKKYLDKTTNILSYDFKEVLIIAKEIEQLTKHKDTEIDLNRIILIKDDHILNLIYEEKRLNPGEFHFAGGHFGDVQVLCKCAQEFTEQPQIISRDVITKCHVCDIAYTRFGLSGDELTKFKHSTTFPTKLKPHFHQYIRTLFGITDQSATDVKCLSIQKTASCNRECRLYKHSATLFNKFYEHPDEIIAEHNHDVYVSMIIFNENDVHVIWTCYILGVFICDWTGEMESAILENTPPDMQIYGHIFSTEKTKQAIYDTFAGNETGKHHHHKKTDKHTGKKAPGKKRDTTRKKISQEADETSTTYSFEEDGQSFNLIGIGNGIYLKIPKRKLADIGEKIGLENVSKKFAAAPAKKVAAYQKRMASKEAISCEQGPQPKPRPDQEKPE